MEPAGVGEDLLLVPHRKRWKSTCTPLEKGVVTKA